MLFYCYPIRQIHSCRNPISQFFFHFTDSYKTTCCIHFKIRCTCKKQNKIPQQKE